MDELEYGMSWSELYRLNEGIAADNMGAAPELIIDKTSTTPFALDPGKTVAKNVDVTAVLARHGGSAKTSKVGNLLKTIAKRIKDIGKRFGKHFVVEHRPVLVFRDGRVQRQDRK